jgi:hypothetical protein
MYSRVNRWVAEDKVDRRVINNVVADLEVNVLGRRWEKGSHLGVGLDVGDLIGGADTGRDEDASSTVSTGGKNDATLRGQGVEALTSADTGDLGTVADNVGDIGTGDHLEVRTLLGGLEVGHDGTATKAVEEAEGGLAESMVLEVRVVVDGDVRVAVLGKEAADNTEDLVEVTLAVGRWGVRAREASLDLVGIRAVVGPRRRPAVLRTEVRVGRVPVETTVDGRATTNKAAGESADIYMKL